MKSKLLILSILFCLNLPGQSVPNTTTFSLQDVISVTGGTSLASAFTNANGLFDPTYMGSKNCLMNFRNYQILYINFTPSYATITALEQEVFFDIDSNYSSYTLSSDQPWCTIILNPGAYSGTASAVVEENQTYGERTARISIISGGITIARYIILQNY